MSTDSPNHSVGLVLPKLSFAHPVVPLVQIFSTTTLGVTASGIGLRCVFSQGVLAVLRGMADIGAVGLAVVLYLSPSRLGDNTAATGPATLVGLIADGSRLNQCGEDCMGDRLNG